MNPDEMQAEIELLRERVERIEAFLAMDTKLRDAPKPCSDKVHEQCMEDAFGTHGQG